MKRVCAIDCGTRNFAWCVVDRFDIRSPVVWRLEDLWAPAPGRRRHPTKVDSVGMAVRWVRANFDMLRTCDAIVLENQMRETFIVLNSAIHALLYDRVDVVHPMTVGTFWGLPTDRENKKLQGIACCKANGARLAETGKQDDLADVWLMAVYYLHLKGAIPLSSLVIFQRPKRTKTLQ